MVDEAELEDQWLYFEEGINEIMSRYETHQPDQMRANVPMGAGRLGREHDESDLTGDWEGICEPCLVFFIVSTRCHSWV